MNRNKVGYYLLIFVCCFVSFGYVQAQVTEIPGYMGVKAGANMSSIFTFSSNALSRGYTPVYGFEGGYFLELPIYPHLTFQPGVNFEQEGAQRNGLQAIENPTSLINNSTAYADIKLKVKLSYVQIPLEAKFIWNFNKKLRGFARLGPTINFLISARQTTSGISDVYSDADGKHAALTNQDFNSYKHVISQFHTINLGGSGTLGLTLDVPKGRLYLELNNNTGLLNIQRNSGTTGHNYTMSFGAQVGYAIILPGVHS